MTGDRSDFSFELACVEDANDLLYAMMGAGLPEAEFDRLFEDVHRSGLPQQILGIEIELRHPLVNWNRVHSEIMGLPSVPFFDPLDFHEFAPRLSVGSMQSIH